MKRNVVIGGIGALILWGVIFLAETVHDTTRRIILVQGIPLEVEIADDPKKQEAGLMYRTQLLEDAGMLFVFEKDETRYFWNKNTHISLDIVWIRNNVIVGTSSLPSMENGPHIVMSPEPVDRVLEVNAGWVFDHAIQRGSAVRYKE